MNKMPDRIWATPYDSDMDGGTYCDAAERPTSPNHDAWCYVRADLALALTAGRDVSNELGKALEEDAGQLREALWAILACETPNANATVTRMASIAKAALKGETP